MLRSFLRSSTAKTDDGVSERGDGAKSHGTNPAYAASAATLPSAGFAVNEDDAAGDGLMAPVSSTYKRSALLFPTAHPASFEPKVQVPYGHVRGRVPRRVEIERRRRLYDSQSVEHLIAVSGLSVDELARPGAQKMPLELFDDTSYDCHNPDEWMDIARAGEDPGSRFLPAEGVFHDEADDTYALRPCRVVGWETASNRLRLLWGTSVDDTSTETGVEGQGAASTADVAVVTAGSTLPRIFVRLLAEDPITYVQRLANAEAQRQRTTAWVMYRLCCDAMPVDGLAGLDDGLAERLRRLGTEIPQLSPSVFPQVKEQADRLIEEISLEWRRSHNRMLLQDMAKRDSAVLRMVTSSTNMGAQELIAGPNPVVQHTDLGNPSTIVETQDYDFEARESAFTFSTYFTQPEVVAALTGVRAECMKVLEDCLFDLPQDRQMSLETFQNRQVERITQVSSYLKNEWLGNVRSVITESFRTAGKGWLNVKESKQDIYEVSKLKKFFTTVKFIMEDTLFELVYFSLQRFTEFFEEVCAFKVKVIDMNHVQNSWPDSDADDCVEKQPLFTINLIEEADRFAYHISFADFEKTVVDLFNKAISCTEAIPQVERYVMAQYFWRRDGEGPFLDSVKLQEDRVRDMRARVSAAVRSSMEPLQVYLDTYDELLPLVRLNKEEFIANYASEEHSLEDDKEEIVRHLKAKKAVAERIPAFLTVGNFVVDCQSFSFLMSKKEEDLAKLVMQHIGKRAKKQSTTVRDEFTKILRQLEKVPQTPEKLYELYGLMDSVNERVGELTADIDGMRQHYSVLESFQFELTDEESRQRWEAIGWPRNLALRTASIKKQLEHVQEELHSGMLKEQEEFSKRVEQLQRVVATFSKHTDASEADKVAAEVKTYNLEIRQCIDEARSINSDQRLFGDKVTDYRNVFELDKEFKPYSDLWLTTYVWQESYRRWHTDAFDTLDPDEIEATVTDSFKTMTNLQKTFKDKQATLRIVDEVRAAVDKFKPWVPIVVSLRHQGMRDRHWKGLSEKLGTKLQPGETIMVLGDCAPLLEHKEEIVSYCEVAAKESQIEKTLSDMRNKWESKLFIIEAYKETGTFILKDASDIVELLDEHLNTTQQLQFSPFKAFYEEDITDWERSLNLIADVLEQWMECQRTWRYLEPIFSSDDIAMQLPKLSKMFDKVDRTWRRVMGAVHSQPNVLEFCIGTNKLLDNLREANRLLEEVQRGLNDYLADKRQAFPRFYFLSDEELLEILSQSKEVRRIDSSISKLFEFISRLEWNDENQIVGYFSGEDEHIPAAKPVTPEGNVEMWLRSVETMMKEAVHNQVKLSFQNYLSTPRAQWVLQWPAQVVIAVAQIFWTQGCEESLSSHGSVAKYYDVLEKQLFELVDVVQSPLTPVQRVNMGALITIEVHAKDTVENMTQHAVSSVNSFDWMKQLRFYFDQTDSLCHIRQVDAHFVYGGEYLGNTGRLVVTPLTDRIYLTLTGALALCLGGAPAGPAGTGKTETTKDLAKALAKQCVVFNCQEGMTYLSMAKFFKGLAWTGAWACFDEFNRIDVEVLSVVAQQVTDLQQACLTKQYRILFEESDITVDPTHAIFITMNPGYAGRTELPDNLKVLFRPVACMVPDYAMIAEIRLFSFGYKKARALAQKMVMTFKLSSEQLSSQDHYDFGMRAVNTVISAAGLNKREDPNGDEDVLLLRALRDSNLPKFLKDDIVLFEGIISDLFPGIELPQTDYGHVENLLTRAVTDANLQPVPAFLEKCLQLYDVTMLRHGLMLVGPAGSGKTTAYTSLQTALTQCASRQAKGENMGQRDFKPVYTHICNPKSVTMDQLYGAYDENGEWKDGVLCVLFRLAAKYGEEGSQVGKHWVMFDGPVDALWIESMNTVLDENKKLCLVSGEIIQMNRDMTMMFEVEDLAVASPATVSRCGMIYLDPVTCVPVSATVKTWAASLPSYMTSEVDTLISMASSYLEPMITVVRSELKEYVPSTKSGLNFSFFRMMKGFVAAFAPPKGGSGAAPEPSAKPTKSAAGHAQPPPQVLSDERLAALKEAIGPLFFFSLVWSVGATCDEVGRERFDARLRELAAANGHEQFLPPATPDEEGGEPTTLIYDYVYQYYPGGAAGGDGEEAATQRWAHWREVQQPFEVTRGMRFDDIIVPTIDSTRQNYVLKHLMNMKVNVASVGPSGTGKSVSVAKLVLGGGMPNTFLGLNFTFSAQTKAAVLQDSLMAKLDKRRSHVYGAPAGKHFLVFIDDANLPQPEKYGAQPPLELMRQLLSQGGFYSFTGGIKWSSIIDLSLTMAMAPPGGGRSRITNRLMRFFNYVAFPEMSDVSKRAILNTILCGGLSQRGIAQSVIGVGGNLVESTLRIFKECCKEFLPTPAHVHYSFSMRDVMRVFPILFQADAKTVNCEDALVRQWMHEVQRVFYDRLIDDQDKATLMRLLEEEVRTLGFEGGCSSLAGAEKLIYTNLLSSNGAYEQVTNLTSMTARFSELLAAYNEETETQMDLVLFLDAAEHVCRIARVLQMPNGHCLLLGIGGSGRKSLTRLACHLIPEMEVFTVELTKNFTGKEWRESLAKLLLECGKDEKKRTFLFSDTQIVQPMFLEDVAGLLTSGDVPNLFEDQEIELINEKFRGICVGENLPTTKVSVYARFIKEVRSNLHIVLAFSPIGEVFRGRMRMFPSLITCCTIDWFAEWPAEALLSVAQAQLVKQDSNSAAKLLGGGKDGGDTAPAVDPEDTEEVSRLSDCFKSMHLAASDVIERFFVEARRRTYVTPTSYLSLLSSFTSMVATRRRFLREQRGRLENGLEKLRTTEERVADLELKLKAQQPVLEEKKEEIKLMMERLAIDRKEAAMREATARKEENAASSKAEECAKMRRECADRLAEAEPALAEAVKVLSKIKASEISELNKYQNPPKGVQYVMEAVALLLTFGNCPREYFSGQPGGKKTADWWLCAKSYMKDANRLLDLLVQPPDKGGFNREAMDLALIEKVRVYYENDEFQPEKVKAVSVPCMAMCLWVRAMYQWFFVNREIQPLRATLASAEDELARVTAALRDTRAMLDEVIAAVQALEKEYAEALETQTTLENEVELTSAKLQRAARLIDGLAGEKARWVELVQQYKVQEGCLVGDMLIAAASVAYCGPLTAPYRNELRERWQAKLKEADIATSEHVDLVSTLGDPVKMQEWQLCGLPSDALSTENAIIMTNSRNWALLIDPQGQANAWIRNVHRNDNLQVCKASSDKFMKTIENAIRLGLPCLLENIGETLDAALEPVLLKNIFLIGSTPHVRIGDSAIPYDPSFRLYMTTKLPNPSYTPETVVTVSLLNFFITPNGLEEQLLAKTVGKERSDLELEKQRLTRDNAEKKRELKELQDNILRMLEEAEGDILEQEELIYTLEKSKTKSAEINDALEKARETERTIDETRNLYRPHALRGSLLFFCVSELSVVDPMYQFSLQWFVNLFLNAVDNTAASESVDERVTNLMDYFTYSFYCNVCRSLFEKHKLTFSFFLCTSIIRHRGDLNEAEYFYLLTGPTGSGGSDVNPAPDWLTINSWSEIQFVANNLPQFKGFSEHVATHVEHYRALFDSAEADSYPLAGEYEGKETPLQRLIVMRCFRKDKVTPAIQQFVTHYIGERYITVPQFDLSDVYKDSDCLTPLLFINSPGSDPMSDVLRFAETMRMSKKLDKVSLGQGQGKKAEELIANGREKGQWVLLQNCHLATSWMPMLESIVENFSAETVKKEFRLWLTSMPSASFPVAVLQIAVKMTNEPPMGLRANVTRSYYGFTNDDLEHESKPIDFPKMVFSLCLFHGVIQERRKFGSLGFNIAYEFNDSDRNVCLLQLRKFLGMYEEIPFDVLTFLSGEINYGGRVTDDWDRRCMMTMISHYMCPEVLEVDYPFSPSGVYRTVVPGNRNYYLDYLNSWPLNPQPEVFGLHANADITCAQNTTSRILSTMLSLVSSSDGGGGDGGAGPEGGGGGGANSRDNALMSTARKIEEILPAPFNEAEFAAKYPTRYEESMNTVLVQEAVRYNRLLRYIRSNLTEFSKAVRGEVVMSAELEAVGSSFFVNAVPAAWSALAYPSLKPLSSWVDDLVRRTKFIQSWYDGGAPNVYWMGGFFFPQAFLTGTLQNFARQAHAAIDTISFRFILLDDAVDATSAPAPANGALVYGLFLEGARWDGAARTLAESRPKELYTEMPVIHFDPVVNRVADPADYVCPVYKTLTRAGTLSTTGHSTNFVLPIELPTTAAPAAHWIERGVACVVSLNF